MTISIYRFTLRSILTVLSFGAANSIVSAQTYLYLEDMTKVRATKIPEESKISVKTVDSKEWTSYVIDRMLADSKSIVHENGFLHLDEITHIRIQRKWVRALGTSLQRFGVGWGIYGAVALAAGLPHVEPSIIITGTIIPVAVGWLMKKAWLWKNYTIGKKNRLKILDLSFPDDPYNEKQQKTYKP